jgi:uncharacterized protein (DUF433 family)
MVKPPQIEWSKSPDIEVVPGRCGGRPTIRGTRIEPDGLVTDFEMGSTVEEIHENFPTVPVQTIERLVAYAHAHQPVP